MGHTALDREPESDEHRSQNQRVSAGEVAIKPAQFVGNPDVPHTYTYLADFVRGLVTLGTHDAAMGQVWHLPSAETLTTRAFVDLVYDVAGHPTTAARLAITAAGAARRGESHPARRAGAGLSGPAAVCG